MSAAEQQKTPTEEYSRRITVPAYDAGPGGLLKPGAAFRLSQETSEQHLEKLGVGYESLKEQTGLVFFMVEGRLRIFRLPARSEEIRISTRPRGQDRAEYYRDFRFFGAGDELLLSCMQVTVLADCVTHRVKRVHSGLEAFGPNAVKPVVPEDGIPRMELPAELAPLGERKIFYSDLDANGHTNNAVYCDVVWDFLPPALRGTAGEIRISYRSETPEGDTLRVSGAENGGKYFLRGDHSAGMSFSACVSPKPDENP